MAQGQDTVLGESSDHPLAIAQLLLYSGGRIEISQNLGNEHLHWATVAQMCLDGAKVAVQRMMALHSTEDRMVQPAAFFPVKH